MSSKKGDRSTKFTVEPTPSWKKRGHRKSHGSSGPHKDRRTKRNRSRNNQKDNWKKELE